MIALTLGDPAGIGPEIAQVLKGESQVVAVDGDLPEPGRPTPGGGEIALRGLNRALGELGREEMGAG